MKSKLSLFGVGLAGLYQLGAIRHTFNLGTFFLFGSVCQGTPGDLVLHNLETGSLIDADNMPVSISPGHFKQGKHDRYGNTDLSQATVHGMIMPKAVSSVLGASLPVCPGTRNTAYTLFNHSGTQTNMYSQRGTTPIAYPLYSRFHKLKNFFDDAKGLSGTFEQTRTSRGLHTVIYAEDSDPFGWGKSWAKYDIWQTGNVAFCKRFDKPGDPPDYQSGSYIVQYKFMNSAVQTLSSSTTSGFILDYFTPPVSLSEISTELILTSINDDSNGRLVRDLLSLAHLERRNSPWLACYYAVESLKCVRIATPETLRDSSQIMHMLPPFEAFAKLASPKSWAQIYLWFIYGVLPTIGDAKALQAAISANVGKTFTELAKEFATLHTKYGTVYDRSQVIGDHKVVYKCNARVAVRPRLEISDRIQVFIAMLDLFNIQVNMANIWELIPYSFVVDWAVNTGRFVKYLDFDAYPTRYSVENIVLSHKFEVDMPISSYYPNQTGLVRLTTYDRDLHYQFPLEPFDLRFTDPSNHWLEGSALLVSRLK